MPVTFRRLYGWDGEAWAPVIVNDDGELVVASETEATVAGITFQRVSDLGSNAVLADILAELKITNTHLQIITDEDIKNAD